MDPTQSDKDGFKLVRLPSALSLEMNVSLYHDLRLWLTSGLIWVEWDGDYIHADL